jgi:hypothetical protein
MQVKYHYFGNRGLSYTNVITVATTIEGDELFWAYAFSNKNDLYSKNNGKVKAVSRLRSNSQSFSTVCPLNANYHNIRAIIEAHLINNSDMFPSWVGELVVSEQGMLQPSDLFVTSEHVPKLGPPGNGGKLYELRNYAEYLATRGCNVFGHPMYELYVLVSSYV